MLDIDTEVLLDFGEKGLTMKEQAEELDCSVSTISHRIARIQAEQGILLKYRVLQNLQLTKLQAKILEAIDDDRINEAPLRDLVVAFKILKDKEQVDLGKPTDIKGLVGYLIKMEKEELALTQAEEEIVEAEVVDKDITNEEYTPDL